MQSILHNTTNPSLSCFVLCLQFGCCSERSPAFFMWKPVKAPSHSPVSEQRCFFLFFLLQIFSRVISTFSPEFMSHSLLWPGEQETHLSADSLFSPGFFLWPLRQRKGKHGGQLERPLTASLSLKRDRKEGWLWELVEHLLYLFSCTDTITETYKKNIFFIYNMRWNVKGFIAGVCSVLTAAPLLFLTINVPSVVI